MLKIAALIAAILLNATPLYDGYRMLKKRSTGSHVPLPACAMLCNASIWTLYGVRLRFFHRFYDDVFYFFFNFDVFNRYWLGMWYHSLRVILWVLCRVSVFWSFLFVWQRLWKTRIGLSDSPRTLVLLFRSFSWLAVQTFLLLWAQRIHRPVWQ